MTNALASERRNPPDHGMQLTDEQKQKIAAWIADGVKLSDIQVRLGEECGVRLTYMDVRMLVDDLKLVPKDPPAPPAPPVPVAPAADSAPIAPAPATPGEAPAFVADLADLSPPAGGEISLTVDTIARPGTLVSGSVTFSDGKTAAWYLDQQGRLGVVPGEQGYRPPEGDVEQFQAMLDRELQKLGY